MNEDLAAQYNAVRQRCGFVRGSSRSLLTLAGEDRERFLNGLVTCGVNDLAPGQGTLGFFAEVKGHILSDVVVRATEEHYRLDIPAVAVSDLIDHIEKYRVADRVEVSPAEGLEALVVLGPTARHTLEAGLSIEVDSTTPWSHCMTDLDGHQIMVAADSRHGVPAWTLWTAASNAGHVQDRLSAAGETDSVTRIGSEVLEAVRIEQGIPRFGIDFGPDTLPQETGIEEAVSYEKGCYLGQEVVARVHYRGQVARCLRRLRSDKGPLPSLRSRLLLDDRDAGYITSAAASPISGEVFALAMLQRRALERGTQLQVDSGEWMQVG